MHKFKLKQISLAICLAAMPFAADAAGLGKLTVVSGLGEPLSAEIELLSTTPEELSSLTAAIAPEEAYNVQGVERTAIHNAIKIEVAKKADGKPILKITTRQPVSDPFLDMLIQVDWSTGRLLREYTVLLDPPGYATQTAASPQSPATTSIGGTEEDVSKLPPLQEQVPLNGATESRSGKSSGKKKSAGAKVAPVVSDSSESGESASSPSDHTTVRGDTLSTIALQNKIEGVSLDQMLVGLYRANKDAFVGGNMNRLKVGQIVRIPGPEELQSISRAEASQEVKVQTADWQAYRNKLAGIVAESTAATEESGNQATGGKITTPAEDKAAPAATGPRDVVKLSKSDPATDKKAATGDAKAMQDKLNSLQEEVTAREKGLKEADERTAMLEKQIADMQKLLSVKNQAMADAQKSAAAQNATPPAAAPSAPATPDAASKPEAPAAPQAEAPVAGSAAAAPAPAAVAPAEQAKPAAEAEKKPPVVVPPPAPVEEPGFLDSLLENPIVLAALAAILALFGGWFFMRNRRKNNLDGFEQGILTSGGLKANTVFGNTSGGTVDTGDTSFLTDFSQSSGGMIDTHDVDPIAEAEVYMAYGRDTQAEEILKDAISKEPKRYELHLKLLEILASRKDTSGFETLAGELYSQLGSTHPVWAKVAELGQKLEPSNPLYQANAVAAVAGGAAAQSALEASDFADAEVMTESSLDFSLDADESAAPAETGDTPAASTLDFDLGVSETASEAAIDLGMDTALDTSIDESPMNTELDAGATISMDMNEPTAGLDFQLDLPEQAAAENTQLDMADLGGMPSLEMGEDLSAEALSAPEPTMAENTVQLDVTEFGNTMPNLEMPAFDLPAAEPVTESPATAPTEDADLSEISFDLPDTATETTSLAEAEQTISMDVQDFDKTMLIQPSAMEEISFEPAAQGDNALDLNFGELDSPAEPTEAAPAVNPPDLDLSGISLDLGADTTSPATDDLTASFDETPAESSPSAVSTMDESDEVNTKLDLVTAYMEIGDNEGARELLDEVMKEGGPKQQARAKEILATIA